MFTTLYQSFSILFLLQILSISAPAQHVKSLVTIQFKNKEEILPNQPLQRKIKAYLVAYSDSVVTFTLLADTTKTVHVRANRVKKLKFEQLLFTSKACRLSIKGDSTNEPNKTLIGYPISIDSQGIRMVLFHPLFDTVLVAPTKILKVERLQKEWLNSFAIGTGAGGFMSLLLWLNLREVEKDVPGLKLFEGITHPAAKMAIGGTFLICSVAGLATGQAEDTSYLLGNEKQYYKAMKKLRSRLKVKKRKS